MCLKVEMHVPNVIEVLWIILRASCSDASVSIVLTELVKEELNEVSLG